MKRSFIWFLTALLFLALSSSTGAQEIKTEEEDPRPYNWVADNIAKAIRAELPGWKHKSVPPLNPAGDDKFSHEVIIDQWSSSEGSVRVAVLLHSSEYEAKDALEKFTAGVKANERLTDVDTEAFAWGSNKSVAFRSGSYTVYISSMALSLAGDDSLDDKRSKEEAKLSKRFAKIVVKALKELN